MRVSTRRCNLIAFRGRGILHALSFSLEIVESPGNKPLTLQTAMREVRLRGRRVFVVGRFCLTVGENHARAKHSTSRESTSRERRRFPLIDQPTGRFSADATKLLLKLPVHADLEKKAAGSRVFHGMYKPVWFLFLLGIPCRAPLRCISTTAVVELEHPHTFESMG